MNHCAYNVLYVEISQKLREQAGECETAYGILTGFARASPTDATRRGDICAHKMSVFAAKCVCIYIYVLHHSAIAICSLKKTHVNLGAQFRAFFAFAESTLLPFGQHFYDGSEWTLPSALQHGASCTWNCRLLDSIGSKRKNIERYCPPHPRDMLTQEKAKTSITLVRFSFRWQIQAQSA